MGDEIRLRPVRDLTASEVAAFLGAELIGKNCQIKTVTPLNAPIDDSLTFSKNKLSGDFLVGIHNVCIITSAIPDVPDTHAYIIVDNPRLAFAKVLAEFFVEKKKFGIGQFTVIDPTAKIGNNVIIGNSCTIGRNVEIGDYSEIRNNVIITDNVKIGRFCLIRSNSVIGEEGFGFENELDGTPIRIPHLGSVEIGDYVEVGNFTAIARGTLKNTVINSHVKIDNLVHIAHNSIIGEKTKVIACAEVSGSTVVGENCWLGVGCSTMQKINIGANSVIGIGAVVLKDVPAGAVMVGNPARVLRMTTAAT